jgi:hypothetical protein
MGYAPEVKQRLAFDEFRIRIGGVFVCIPCKRRKRFEFGPCADPAAQRVAMAKASLFGGEPQLRSHAESAGEYTEVRSVAKV